MTKKEILNRLDKIAAHITNARALAEELHGDLIHVDITCDGEMFDDDVIDMAYAAEDAEERADKLIAFIKCGDIEIEE